MKNADRTRFKGVGERGNERLLDRTVAIAGLGSVGSAAAAMLARENLGLRLIDMGRVEETDMLEGDVIVDTTNSDAMNSLVLTHAAKKKYPLIIARASGSRANILVLQKNAPAKIVSKITLPSVEKAGVFSPATHIAASIVVAETIRILTGSKESKLITVDGWESKIKVTKI